MGLPSTAAMKSGEKPWLATRTKTPSPLARDRSLVGVAEAHGSLDQRGKGRSADRMWSG
jgi:hypothetical protein